MAVNNRHCLILKIGRFPNPALCNAIIALLFNYILAVGISENRTKTFFSICFPSDRWAKFSLLLRNIKNRFHNGIPAYILRMESCEFRINLPLHTGATLDIYYRITLFQCFFKSSYLHYVFMYSLCMISFGDLPRHCAKFQVNLYHCYQTDSSKNLFSISLMYKLRKMWFHEGVV